MEVSDEPKIREIADHYGYDAQSRQLVEEMAELTQAVNKFWRKRVGGKLIPDRLSELLSMPEYSLLTSEIADVYLMLEQIRYLLQYSDKDLENDIMYKIDRTIARMEDD